MNYFVEVGGPRSSRRKVNVSKGDDGVSSGTYDAHEIGRGSKVVSIRCWGYIRDVFRPEPGKTHAHLYPDFAIVLTREVRMTGQGSYYRRMH